MATRNEDETKECFFRWTIENICNFWWLNERKFITSPTFIADALIGTKWSLRLYLKSGKGMKNNIGFYLHREEDCSGPDVIEVSYELAFLGKDGSLLKEKTALTRTFAKGESWGFQKFEGLERVFVTEREAFLSEDTLTVQCVLRKIEETIKSKHLYGRTVLKVNRKSFVWKINEFSSLEPGSRNKYKDGLVDFDLVLNQVEVDRKLDVDIFAFDDRIQYISFYASVTDSEGKKENVGMKNYFPTDLKKEALLPVLLFPKKLMENKSQYLPNDVLSLDFEFVFSTVEYFGCGKNSSKLEDGVSETNGYANVSKEKSENATILTDFKLLFNEGTFSDTELRTQTQTFPAHKGILSARSPVLRRMFCNDMKENNTGHVDITDLDDDTVHQMLLYIYTDTLGDLKLENASKLYTAADKYEILSLKSKCSLFLKDNLCPTRVCDVLILADLHHDEDLKNASETYILEHDEVFSTVEWENFMDNNIKLAAEIMYKKVNPGKIYKRNL